MGKLTITVNQCRLMRLPSIEAVNPRICLEIDGLHQFHTRRKINNFTPTFGDSFTVADTHRFAVVNVSVFHVSIANSINANEETLLGGCRLSIEWAVRSRKRSRSYVLVSKDNSSLLGAVDITLKSDFEGEADRFTDEKEDAYVKRLTRFLMVHDRSLLRDMDLIMSSVKGVNATSKNDSLCEMNTGKGRSVEELEISKNAYRTFADLMASLCKKYKCTEPVRKSLSVVVEGCTYLEKPLTYFPSQVFVVIRTECEQRVTTERPYSCNPVWLDAEFEVDVLDPDTHPLYVMVVYRPFNDKCRELGRAAVRMNTLSHNRVSTRQIFIFNHKDRLSPTITGIVHLALRTHRWGPIPRSLATHVDDYYMRLNRFFYRYDQRRLLQLDSLIYGRLYNLKDLMSELEILYGREPGTVELWITVQDLYSLHNEKMEEVDGKEVEIVLTMGEYVMRTQPKRVKINSRTVFDETFAIDVARETDMIKFEVIETNRKKKLYGRADFTCVLLQRGVKNHRELFLIGNAATDEAYLSGMISIAFYSEQIGQAWRIDLESQSMYAGRLRRYVQSCIPSKLHLVDMAVCTVFDFDNFLLDMAREHGEENPTYVVYVNILGCRELKARLGFGINAYVVARMGIERYETLVVRNNTEPDFFHFVEFYFDTLEEAKMTLFVMNRCGHDDDSEIGRVEIELGGYEVHKHHHIWFNIFSPCKPKGGGSVGLVGARFIVKKITLKDDHSLDQYKFTSSVNMRQGLTRTERKGFTLHRRQRSGGWRNKMTRVTAHLRTNSTTSSSASYELSSSKSSECEAPKAVGSLNLMDACIHSVNEFCLGILESVTNGLMPGSPTAFSSEHQINSMPNKENNFDMADTVISDRSRDTSKKEGKLVVNSFQEKKLRVRVVCCKNLQSRKLTPPSPYVMLSTLHKTQQTMRQFCTASPRFNEEFLFYVKDPIEDFLSITVITETTYGKKCLGHCVLSMKNIQRDTPRTRWVSLVSEPSRPGAKQQGTICLTISGENFGLDYFPSLETENRLRRLLKYTFLSRLPKELHRLEYYTAEYLLCEDEIMGALSNNTKKEIETEDTDVTLSVTSVSQLFLNDRLVENCACVVKTKINDNTIARTKPVHGINGCFAINQTCKMSIPSSEPHPIRVVAYINEKEKRFRCGECLLLLEDLHLNVARERTHILVINAGLHNAKPVGYITLSFHSSHCETPVIPLSTDSEKQYIRVRDYFFYYFRPRLHAVDVEYRNIFDIEAHLKALVKANGPEPGRYSLRFQIRRCCLIHDCGGPLHCVLRVGLQQYETSTVSGKGEYTFIERFNVQIGLPDKEEIWIILILGHKTAGGGVEVDIGRTVVPLDSIKLGSEVTLNLPLFDHIKRGDLMVVGSVEVTLFTDDFGTSTDLSTTQPHACKNNYGLIQKVLGSHLDELYRLKPSTSDAQGHGGEGNYFTYSAVSTLSTRVCIILVALLDFPEQQVYIRATVNNNVVLRTGTLESLRFGCISEKFYLEKSHSVLDSVIVIKVAKRQLGRSSVICFCEFAICNCLRGTLTTKYLRLFDSKRRSIGRLQVGIGMPADIGHLNPPSVSASELESITDDVASLMAKYIPEELCRLDVKLSRSNNLRELHHALRQDFAKNVLATVYCAVHSIDLLYPVKGLRVVEVSLNGDVERVVEHQLAFHTTHNLDSQDAQKSNFPHLRLDLVSNFDALLLRVFGDEEESELCRAFVSLRAVLTPALYDTGEEVSVPLVKVAKRRRSAHGGAFAGVMTFSLVPPLLEKYPPALQLPIAVSDKWRVRRPVVRWYFNRIVSLLKHYDAQSLVNFHHLFYETYVAREDWDACVKKVFASLLEKWGPEVETFDPPPSSMLIG